MDAERWRKLEACFSQALSFEGQERLSFLEEFCGKDLELLMEVNRLLEADRSANNFIEEAVRNGAEKICDKDAQSWIGKRLGPYRIIREIGRGGMSSVYLGLRDDAQFRHRVAIKLIRKGMDTDDIRKRFRNERQILANLDHPNIAKLHDGGETEDGRPYFVMEYIEGEPVDLYCDRNRLSLTQRLSLFRTICRAVSFAHQNLIIHRDLKPGNVLVTGTGEVKLLDFGIAKLLCPAHGEGHVDLTGTTSRPMTVSYASPEQICGEAVATTGDVYSLGVLAYRLLTGHHPFGVEVLSNKEIETAVCHGEPERPSAVVDRTIVSDKGEILPYEAALARGCSLFQLKRRLKGDLDTILLMALRREPERRYPSVDAFSSDMGRYMAGKPVYARRSTLGYVLSKFIRRYWVGVSAAGAFVFLLVFSLIGMTVISKRISEERDRAEQVSDLLVDLFHVPAKAKSHAITGKELLDAGAEKVRALEDQPQTKDMLLATLGDLYWQLGLYGSAVNMQRSVLAIRLERWGENHEEVAASYYHLGVALACNGNYEEGAEMFRRALDIRIALFGEEHPETAKSFNNLGLSYHDMGWYEKATPYYQKSTEVSLRLLGEDHPETRRAMQNMSLLHFDLGRYDDVERVTGRILTRQRAQDVLPIRSMIANQELLGMVYRARGDFKNAEALLMESLGFGLFAYGEDHPNVAKSMTLLGAVLGEINRMDEAETLLREALELRRGLGEHVEAAMTMEELALVLAHRGLVDEAESLLDEALVIYNQTYSTNHPLKGHPLIKLGIIYQLQGRLNCAETSFKQGIELLPEKDWQVSAANIHLAFCLVEMGRNTEATALFDKNISLVVRRLGPHHKDVVKALALYEKLSPSNQALANLDPDP